MKILYFKLRAIVVTWLMRLLPRNPPIVFKGPNSSLALCEQVGVLGFDKVMLVTDEFLNSSGLLDKIKATLDKQGVEFAVFDAVLPDPAWDQVQAGEALIRTERCQAIIAVGGGSVLDAAKMMAMLHTNPGSLASFDGIQKSKNPGMPLFAIPTTAGTGSEITLAAVITDPVTHRKAPIVDSKMIPGYIALDAEIMKGMPPGITAATGMDALTHAIESYIGSFGNAETDFYGLAAARMVFKYLPIACRDGDNLEAREAMALASYYGGLAITQALVGYVHAVSHNLGARYGIPHGLGNAMVLPHVLELMKKDATGKMAEIAVHAQLGEGGEADSVLAQKLVDRVWELNREIGIPQTCEAIRAEDIEELVEVALAEGAAYPSPRFLEAHECRALLTRLSTGA